MTQPRSELRWIDGERRNPSRRDGRFQVVGREMARVPEGRQGLFPLGILSPLRGFDRPVDGFARGSRQPFVAANPQTPANTSGSNSTSRPPAGTSSAADDADSTSRPPTGIFSVADGADSTSRPPAGTFFPIPLASSAANSPAPSKPPGGSTDSMLSNTRIVARSCSAQRTRSSTRRSSLPACAPKFGIS